MGCGASNDISRVQAPTTLEKKSVLPAINMKSKTKSPSAKSNGSTDSGIEDSEPPKSKAVSSKVPFTIDNLLVEHHQKSRLGHGETFDIVAAPKPGRLAPLKHVPRFVADSKQTTEVDADLKTKIAAKLERASRKRREIEEARRQASSRIGYRAANKPTEGRAPITTNETFTASTRDERHQQLSQLRDQLRGNTSNNSLYNSMHTPRTPRGDSMSSGTADVGNLTPRRAALVMGATTAVNFKPVYD